MNQAELGEVHTVKIYPFEEPEGTRQESEKSDKEFGSEPPDRKSLRYLTKQKDVLKTFRVDGR